ncbi:gliding motility-associated ABC transporter substrate-binding protein GldG [Luteibaculum oceani]|nr:gliding motility-associated ABC transporter substrate-binding protein GldG [Luteibaculum oceani]
MSRRKTKVNALLSVLISLGILIFINVLNQSFFKRFDLTSDQRHSLRDASVEIVEELEDPVFVRVYLEGEFPADFKRLRNAVKQILDELRAYAGENIQYEFINPSASNDPVKKKEMYTKLSESGLTYTNLTIRTKDGVEEKILFPGALITYRNKEIPLQLLKSTNRVPSPEMMQNSINNLEYNLLSAIHQVTQTRKKKIAWIGGHGEITGLDAYDMVEHLAERYTIFDVNINEKLNALIGYDLIIIAGPKEAISEKDKFIIDQFIMKGGAAMFLVDGLQADMDSLQSQNNMMALASNHNLWDMLFNYGVRLKRDVLMDAACAMIPINVGKFGDQANLKMFPWYFHPTLITTKNHPISANVNPVFTQFLSSLDTVGNDKDIKKTILLETSPLTLRRMAPARINLNTVSIDPGFEKNSIGKTPVAVLLEGKFKSLYANRLTPNIEQDTLIAFQEKALLDTRIMVVGDGEITKNYSNRQTGTVYPLGYDKFLRKIVYGNKDFLANAVDYLLNDERLIKIRAKEIEVRKLNDRKILAKESEIQLANLALPIIIVGVFVFIILIIKRRKFS